MANKTKIEWTDWNWNFLRGCSTVSEGCRNCYAEGVAARFSGPGQPYEGLAKFVDHKPRWTGEISFHEDVRVQPLRWKKPRKVFVNSMSDLFHEKVKDEWLDKAFAVMALTPQHTYQVLTKRPDRMLEYLTYYNGGRDHNRADYIADAIAKLIGKPGARGAARTTTADGKDLFENWPLPNVWFGVSAEDRDTYITRVPYLTMTPGATKFISFEPLLGDIGDLMLDGIFGESYQWAIAGGESGPEARPMHPDWVRSIRDQCQSAGVPFFFKQWGEYRPFESTAQPPFHRDCATGKEYDGHGMNFTEDGFEPGRFMGAKWMDMHEAIIYNEDEDDCMYLRLGKKKAGRLLDGREWNEYPNG